MNALPWNALVAELVGTFAAAAVLGALGGIFLCRAFSGRRDDESADPAEILLLEQRLADLRSEQGRKDDQFDALRQEMEGLREAHRSTEQRLIEFSTRADESESIAILRDQLEALRRDRDGHRDQLDAFREQNRSLQQRLEESADRLVELEREKMRQRQPAREERTDDESRHSRPAHTESSGAAVGSDPISRPERRATPERPRPKRSEPAEHESGFDLQVEKSMPLTVQGEHAERVDVGAEEDVAVDTLPPVQPGEDYGTECALDSLPSLDDDPGERLTLIGISTNLALLRKAGSVVGRNALAKSMRVDVREILKWVNEADLLRVGMRGEDVSGLIDAGIRSIDELARADVDSLFKRLQNSAKRKKDRGTIDEAAVKRWILRAGELPRMVQS